MRNGVVLLTIAGLAACSGHNLDTPIKTCKAVMGTLAAGKELVWHGERQEEQKDVQLVVTLEFRFADQPADQVSQAVCIYGLSSPDLDYRLAMGEYSNVPTKMLVNGKPIPDWDLVQAINRATVDTAKAIGQETWQKLNRQ